MGGNLSTSDWEWRGVWEGVWRPGDVLVRSRLIEDCQNVSQHTLGSAIASSTAGCRRLSASAILTNHFPVSLHNVTCLSRNGQLQERLLAAEVQVACRSCSSSAAGILP